MCHEIFTPIFSWFKSIWAPEKQPKVFSNLVSILLRYLINQSLWCASHCRVKGWTFRKIYADASHHGDKCSKLEKISEVGIPPLSQSPWCASHRRDKLHTVETKSTCLRLLLKGQSVEILLGVNTSIMKEKISNIKCWFTKKNGGQKSCDSLPLTCVLCACAR